MSANPPLLQLQNVSRRYGEGGTAVMALDGANLEVREGEFVAVMGPSGSGKSTLLHLAGALDSPTAGTVLVTGIDIANKGIAELAKLRRRHVGYVFQDFNLISQLTVLENVALPLALDRNKNANVYAEEALEQLGMTALAKRFPDEISGGQAQRVALARAIVGPRKLILADEPTGALDTASGHDVVELLRQRVDAGAGALVVTHDARVAAYADRVIFLRDGRIIDETEGDRPENLLGTPW